MRPRFYPGLGKVLGNSTSYLIRQQWRHCIAYIRARFGSTVQFATELPSDGPTAKAMRGESPPSGSYFEAGTTVSAWFRKVWDNSYRNDIIVEQPIALGRVGRFRFYILMEGITHFRRVNQS